MTLRSGPSGGIVRISLKVLSEADRRRVASRVKREAGHMFRDVIPVSLIGAQDAGDDPDAWRSSGLEAMLAGLEEIIADLEGALAVEPASDPSGLFAADPVDADHMDDDDEANASVQLEHAPTEPTPAAAASGPVDARSVAGEEAPVSRVVPRRVVARAGGEAMSQRPRRAASGSLI